MGGYELAVPASALTIAEVVETLGGPLFPFMCLGRKENEERCRECPGAEACPAQQALSGACAAAYSVLQGLALSEVAGLLPEKPPANEPPAAVRTGHPRPRVGGGR